MIIFSYNQYMFSRNYLSCYNLLHFLINIYKPVLIQLFIPCFQVLYIVIFCQCIMVDISQKSSQVSKISIINFEFINVSLQKSSIVISLFLYFSFFLNLLYLPINSAIVYFFLFSLLSFHFFYNDPSIDSIYLYHYIYP